MQQLTLLFVMFLFSAIAQAGDKLYIAVASNFEHTLAQLRQDFQSLAPTTEIVVSAAASGSHFQQIRHGAPFDIFLSAEADYPVKLDDQKPRLTYAYGKLALASKEPIDIDALDTVILAIANPAVAPYGTAAIDFLNTKGVTQSGPVGNSVGQTLGFLMSGSVDAALVSLSQRDLAPQFIWQPIAEQLYQPIKQAAILLNDTPISRTFWDYLQSQRAKDIISANGYGIE